MGAVDSKSPSNHRQPTKTQQWNALNERTWTNLHNAPDLDNVRDLDVKIVRDVDSLLLLIDFSNALSQIKKLTLELNAPVRISALYMLMGDIGALDRLEELSLKINVDILTAEVWEKCFQKLFGNIKIQNQLKRCSLDIPIPVNPSCFASIWDVPNLETFHLTTVKPLNSDLFQTWKTEHMNRFILSVK